jgi:hypothetical protein
MFNLSISFQYIFLGPARITGEQFLHLPGRRLREMALQSLPGGASGQLAHFPSSISGEI